MSFWVDKANIFTLFFILLLHLTQQIRLLNSRFNKNVFFFQFKIPPMFDIIFFQRIRCCQHVLNSNIKIEIFVLILGGGVILMRAVLYWSSSFLYWHLELPFLPQMFSPCPDIPVSLLRIQKPVIEEDRYVPNSTRNVRINRLLFITGTK